MVGENEVKKLGIEIERLKQALMYIEAQKEELEKTLSSLSETKKSIESLKDVGDNEFFIDLGEGIFLKVKPCSDKLLVYLDRVIVEKSPEEAIEKINESIKKIEEALNNISEKEQELINKYNETAKKLEEIYKQSMGSGL